VEQTGRQVGSGWWTANSGRKLDTRNTRIRQLVGYFGATAVQFAWWSWFELTRNACSASRKLLTRKFSIKERKKKKGFVRD